MSSPIPPPPMNRHSSIDTSNSGSSSSSSSANHLENMTVPPTATVIVKKSSGARSMARKSTGGSALPKYTGGRRVEGKEVKLPPNKKYRVSSGVRALAEIRRYQNSTELLIKADIPEASLGDCEGSVLGGV